MENVNDSSSIKLQSDTEKSSKTYSSFKISYSGILDRQYSDSNDIEYENYYVLSPEHIKQIGYELGIVQTCWPEITLPCFENRTQFPESYFRNSEKEKLALLQAENFRQQYKYKFPNRRSLVLAAENDCGLQKLVCNTVRPTTLPYLELKQWKQTAQFVADYINYEPLDRPTLPSKRDYRNVNNGISIAGEESFVLH